MSLVFLYLQLVLMCLLNSCLLNHQLQQLQMSQIKEVQNLNTLNGIRRVTQETLRPVIEEIQRKMVFLSKQAKEASSKTQLLLQLQSKQHRAEESIRYLQNQLLTTRQLCQTIQLQQASQKETWSRTEERFQEQIRKLKRDKENQDATIDKMKVKTEIMGKQVATALSSVKKREDSFQQKFQNFSQKSQQLFLQVKQNSVDLRNEFIVKSEVLHHQLKSNLLKLANIDILMEDRQTIQENIIRLNNELQNTIKEEDFAIHKKCIEKQQRSVVKYFQKMFEDNFSQTTKNILHDLPQMKEDLLHCLNFQKKIQESFDQLKQLDGVIRSNKSQHEETSKEIKKIIDQKFDVFQKQKQIMMKNIEKALNFQNQVQTKLIDVSEKLKIQLREQNNQKMKQLYEEIKVSFADKKQQMRERQLQKIIDQRKRLFVRCSDIQSLGNKIGQTLTNFSTKITKLKSDTEIFMDKIKKQMAQIDSLKIQLNQNTNKIGQILSQIMQTILLNNCIQIQGESKVQEELAFSTHLDGIIYQKFSHNKMQHPGKMLYRRKMLDMKLLKRAMVTSIMYIYDELMDENCCLGWHQQSPSTFFKEHIEPVYRNLSEKYQENKKIQTKQKDSLDMSTIQAKERMTIGSAMDTHDSQNMRKYTFRARKTRYEQPGTEIFASRSARRVRGNITSGILGMN